MKIRRNLLLFPEAGMRSVSITQSVSPRDAFRQAEVNKNKVRTVGQNGKISKMASEQKAAEAKV